MSDADDPMRDETMMRRHLAGQEVANGAFNALEQMGPLAVVALITWEDGSVTVNATQQKDHPAGLLAALRAAKLWGPEWATRAAQASGIPPEALLTKAALTPPGGGN